MDSIKINNREIPVSFHNTLILGSGAASLAAAVRLKRSGQDDICLITDNMNNGTSRNTGSDKQTYYKLSDSSREKDSPYDMAQALYDGGAVHGDIALVEALCSENGFYHLVGLGVPFPHNKWGGYTGYKTDHDPLKRGTSLGPYTSRVMVEYLEKEVRSLSIPLRDKHDCIKLIKVGNRIAGALVLDKSHLESSTFGLKVMLCNNMIFGLGGPGGMYKRSVYPSSQSGGIGLALEAGAEAVNLTESQFGIGSVKFRWNLSGSYQQVIPSYYSLAPGDDKRIYFLNEYFDSMESLGYSIFLKGYQWPFDPDKVAQQGSSLIDLLIYRETEMLGRKVYMDFRENLQGDDRIGSFSPHCLSEEAAFYWGKSHLTGDTPIQRLEQLNPGAIRLYKDHNIDLTNEPLEIDVCAQHNNGGLAGDIWWESTNLSHFFPIGEVNGSHGIYRPGGTALNSGQVAAFRCSQKITTVYNENTLDLVEARRVAERSAFEMLALMENLTITASETDVVRPYREQFQHRMSSHGAFVRDPSTIEEVCSEARNQLLDFENLRVIRSRLPLVLKLRHLIFAHWCYLEAIKNYCQEEGGSRGSYLVKSSAGRKLHSRLESDFNAKDGSDHLRQKIQILKISDKKDQPDIHWVDCRPIPDDDHWFESVWEEYRNKTLFE